MSNAPDTPPATVRAGVNPTSRPAAAGDFTITFRSFVGPTIAGAPERLTLLQLKGGAAPVAVMLLTRHNGDLMGRPVGLFSAPVAADRVAAIARAADALDWPNLPQPTRGDISAAMLSLDYQRGGRIISRQFNMRNVDFMRAVGPVVMPLSDLMSGQLVRPVQALEVLASHRLDGNQVAFDLELRSVGTGPVMVADPRLPMPAALVADGPRAYVQVALEPTAVPGQMEIPPVWQRVALEPAPADAKNDGRLLPAGASLRVSTRPLAFAEPGTYLYQAVWQDYLGPVVDPNAVAPAEPADTRLSGKPIVIRGSTFSVYGRFKIGR